MNKFLKIIYSRDIFFRLNLKILKSLSDEKLNQLTNSNALFSFNFILIDFRIYIPKTGEVRE